MYVALAGIIGGVIGGIVKSCLEHNGKLLLPYKGDNVLVLGFVADVIGGAAIGFAFTEPFVLNFFGFQPGFWLSFITGAFWLAIFQRLGMLLPIAKSEKKNGEVEIRKKGTKTNSDSKNFLLLL